jgi:rhodanese-related sulfurtransferase
MHLRPPLVPTIDILEAAPAPVTHGRPEPLLVDVRERDEFVDLRAPGAVLYPTSSFLLRFEELPRDRPLHVICRTGSRSAAVTAFLLRNGWTDVQNVAGGMVAWARAGREVRRGPLEPGEGELVWGARGV